MDKLQQAIQHYHQLMEQDLGAAEADLHQLEEMQRTHKTSFGGRPLTSSLRPAFITESRFNEVQTSVYLLRSALLKIIKTHVNQSKAIHDILRMKDWEIELSAIPCKVISISALSRMDSFITPEGFKFVELNAESPAGIAYHHELAKIYRDLPVFKQFAATFPVRYVSPLQHTIDAMLRVYHEQWDGLEEHPSFAIVDILEGQPTVNEFKLTKEYLERMGFACEIADPRSLECKDGWIYANGRKIDILYRRLLMNEYYDIKDDCKAYLEGYKAGKTCYLNSFRSKLLHKKSIFEFLTDEQYTGGLSEGEKEAIHKHIPWTRIFADRKTDFRGLKVDLVEFVRNNPKLFVLKPNDEYGGKGVMLGFDVSQSEWDDAIETALAHDYVVQETVDIHREPFLVKSSDGWAELPFVVDFDPYVMGPLMGGCLTRISTSNLANVTAGGGTLPTFILRFS